MTVKFKVGDPVRAIDSLYGSDGILKDQTGVVVYIGNNISPIIYGVKADYPNSENDPGDDIWPMYEIDLELIN